MHPWMTGRLVAVPGVVREIPPRPRLVRSDPPNLGVEQGQRVVQPVHAVLAQHAKEAHAASHLDRSGAGAAHGIDHFRLISLRAQPFGTLVSRVGAGDGLERSGDVLKRLLPRDLDELVVAAPVEQIGRPKLRREFGESRLGPRLPASPDDRVAQAVRSVEDSMKGVALRALAGIPVCRCVVAVEVGVVLIVVGRAGSHDDAVADVGSDTTRVGVVGRAHPVEHRVVPILVVVDRFPVPRHGTPQRIPVIGRFEEGARRLEAQHGPSGADAHPLQEQAARYAARLRFAWDRIGKRVLVFAHGVVLRSANCRRDGWKNSVARACLWLDEQFLPDRDRLLPIPVAGATVPHREADGRS